MRVHPGTSRTLLRSMIHHAAPLLSFSSVVLLALAVVQAALGTALVLAASLALRKGPHVPPASVRAVPMPAIAAGADVKQLLAGAAPTLAEADQLLGVRLGKSPARSTRALGGTRSC